MEYVFGTNKNKEILRTKGSQHSNLFGYRELVREYPDQLITDRYHVIRKTASKEDTEGNRYDWYEIDQHYRFTDKFSPAREGIETGIKENSDAAFDLAEIADENSNSVFDIAEYMQSLEERIEALEGGKNDGE